MPSDKYTPPYPTSPEILREVAKHFGTKTKRFDDYAQKGHHDENDHRQLIKQAFVKRIGESSYKLGKRVEEYLKRAFSQYHGQVLQTWVGGLEREDINGPLLETFSVFGLGAINFITHGINRPDFAEWFSENRLLPYTFRWIEQTHTSFREVENELTPDRQRALRKWKSGQHIPSFSLIQKLTAEFLEAGLPPDECEQVFTLLIAARTVDSFLDEDGTGKRLEMLRHHIRVTGDRFIDVWGRQEQDRESLILANDLARKAESILDVGPSTLTEQQLGFIRNYLDAAWEKHKTDNHKDTLLFVLHRVEGKYATVIGDPKSALQNYKKAFNYSLYTAGKEQLKIIQEALAVAAVCEDRVFLKNLKKQAIAFGLYHYFEAEQPDPLQGNQRSRSKDNFVEDWEVDQWKETFPQLFPQSIWPIDEQAPFIVIKGDLSPDFDRPNRERQISDGRPKTLPDTVLFSEWNNKVAVKGLLKSGADISQISKEGESCLLMAIQEVNPTLLPFSSGDDELFHLIYEQATKARNTLNPDCTILKMVNTPTVKRKLTPLGCAIETGRIDIVVKVLKLGAHADQRFGLDQRTPLHHCIGLMDRASSAQRFRETYANYVESAPIEIQRETIRRYTGAVPPKNLGPRHQVIHDAVMEIMIERFGKVSRDDLRSIAELLLNYGASPNARCSNGMVSEFTPLMLAIEIDDVELFRLMKDKYDGDTSLSCYSHTNNEFYKCNEIAWHWGSKKVLEAMNCVSSEHNRHQ